VKFPRAFSWDSLRRLQGKSVEWKQWNTSDPGPPIKKVSLDLIFPGIPGILSIFPGFFSWDLQKTLERSFSL
jgi:hypothetical protein